MDRSKNKAVDVRKERRHNTGHSHAFTVAVVCVSLGLVAVGGMAGVLILTYYERSIDAAVATMVGSAIGSLATLLTNVRTESTAPVQAEITNLPTQPVPVEPVSPADGEE